jgi:hypothetical protein
VQQWEGGASEGLSGSPISALFDIIDGEDNVPY